MATLAYDADGGAFDEALTADGRPREHYRGLLAALASSDLEEMGRGVADTVASLGVSFGAGAGFVVDPVPRIVPAAEWARLEAGLAQRVRALNALVADAYGPRAAVREGVLPARVLDTAGHFLPGLHGVDLGATAWAPVCGLDLVRDATGRWLVLEDNLRTPSGLAYAVAARDAVDGRLPQPPPGRRLDLDPAWSLLGQALRAAAGDRPDPAVVVLTDGPAASAYYEHRAVARALELPLVTLADLEMARGRLWRRTASGREPVDVVYRRTDEDRPFDGRGRPTAVGEALLEPWRRGRVACVNAFGTGVADDKLVHAYVEDLVRFFLGEEPLLGSVPTYDLMRADQRDDVLARPAEVVLKPRTGEGGRGVVVGPHAREADLRRAVARARARPGSYVAQELVVLSTHPTVVAGRLEPRHVDLRPFVLVTGDGPRVAPGGLTRFALDAGALVVNSSQEGGAKDTWALR